jgi:hypothetical protein
MVSHLFFYQLMFLGLLWLCGPEGVIPDSRSTCDKIGESELKAKQS